MQTLNTRAFIKTLDTLPISIESLIDKEGLNIFHEIAFCVSKEAKLLEYAEIAERHTNQIATLLNSQTIKEGLTPLHHAIKHKRRQLTKEFIRLGADPLVKDHQSQSCLHMASLSGDCALFSYLWFELGLSVEEVDSKGRTPLHLAALEANESLSLLIIARSRAIDLKDTTQLTALHYTAYSNNYRIARCLIMNAASRDS